VNSTLNSITRRALGALGALALAGLMDTSAMSAAPPAEEFRVYFGTSGAEAKSGIYLARLDTSSGKLTAPERVAETLKPSFLALHPSGRFVYAVNEVDDFQGSPVGAASAFAVDPATGRLTLLNQVSAKGTWPCHLTLDRQGRHLLVANYGSGNVAALKIGSDGRLGEASAFVQHTGRSVHATRQEAPHAHSVDLDAANRFAFVSDLGVDRVYVYRFDADRGTLEAHDPPFAAAKPGAGPRHFAFSPDQRHAYVVNELSQTVGAYRYDAARGTLQELGTVSLLPEGETPREGTGAAEVQLHPSGRFLYASNRGPNVIVVFAVDPERGTLTRVEQVSTGGDWPRHFAIDPSGRWLLASNQRSNTVVVFRVDAATGRLTPTGQVLDVKAPSCAVFLKVGSAPARR